MNSNKGFTIIELIMVLVIIAILAVVVIISYNPNKLAGAADKLMFDLRYAQQLAISRQASCGVSFNPANESYFVYINNTANIATDPHTKAQFIVNYNNASEYNGIDIVSTNFGNLVSFGVMGTPYNSAGTVFSSPGTVTLQSGGSAKTVTIQPNTGEVKTQ